MSFDVARARAAAELIRRRAVDAVVAIGALLFARQLELFRSALLNRRTAALAGRRSGKSHTYYALVVLACAFLGWNVLLVFPNAKQARTKALGKITRLARLLGLAVNTNRSDGVVAIGRGQLEIGSAHTFEAADSIRGDGLHLAIIDEPASIDDEILCYLMDEVVGPALMDHGGHWLMVGTPGSVPGIGRWYDVSTGRLAPDNQDARWHLIDRWTYRDNPTLDDPDRTIDAELAASGHTRMSDWYLREYEAQWVAADAERPLHWSDRNDYLALPDAPPVLRVIGIDVGHTDADALVALYVWRGAVYLAEEDETRAQTTEQLTAKTKAWRERHHPHVIVADSANAKTIADLQAAGVAVEGAKKGRGSVGEGLRQLDGLLREGRFFARQRSAFARDSAVIRWDPKHPGQKLTREPHSDVIPAVLYGMESVNPYLLTPAPPPPPAPERIWSNPLLRAQLVDPSADRPDYR